MDWCRPYGPTHVVFLAAISALLGNNGTEPGKISHACAIVLNILSLVSQNEAKIFKLRCFITKDGPPNRLKMKRITARALINVHNKQLTSIHARRILSAISWQYFPLNG
ncbi:Rho GTPase activation protein (RhoGAP) with PHdomain [Striga asiatica]|uniref:Rho GTPase activation protein (RhoGAP) with PHdomain n=1 Tax=Striga asiatica TaxID=4170 RepID=A0A5A7QJ03_STRAF|nr:Rho GTPase activation protein (RhoGAP) with PHdomain [Striga asiatica]